MTQASVISHAMRDTIGVESYPVTYDVEKGSIIKFAEAIGDPNPIFNDETAARKTHYGGIVAPPTFLRSAIPGKPKVEFPNPYAANLDGGSEWEYLEPVRPGDRITVTDRIVDILERQGRLGNMLFVIREIKYVNQFGTPVALQRTTSISYNPPE